MPHVGLRPPRRLLLGALLLALLAAPNPLAEAAPTELPSVPSAAKSDATARSSDSAARYIVQLEDAPLLTYSGNRPGYSATAPSLTGQGAERFDASAPESLAYEAYLSARQAAFEAEVRRVAPTAQSQYHYTTAFNGVTLKLSADEAEAVEHLPGVVSVTKEERVVPLMDVSPGQIRAVDAWNDPRIGGQANAGRDVRIAVIDTGITASHPFFDDTGFVLPADGDFPIATWTVGDRERAYPPEDVARFTNNKVIVARAYANPDVFDPEAPLTPLAMNMHGAHVAGIAAGSPTTGAPGAANGSLPISGVAPGAYLMSYRFDQAYTPEILRMIEDAVRDGADVINNSWGTSAMNVIGVEGHPVVEAFRAATEAGIVVVAAAGNSGTTGEASLGGPHQMSDDVLTVANVQTGRSFAYELTASDAGLPDDLTRHAAGYGGLGRLWDEIDRPVIRNDLCNPVEVLTLQPGHIVLAPAEGVCDEPILGFGEPFGWLDRVINAGLANMSGRIVVDAVVIYAPDQFDEHLMGLMVIDILAPVFEIMFPGIHLPITGVIAGDDAMALVDWSKDHPTLQVQMSNDPETVMDPTLVDAAHETTSQGPAPDGRIKPDLSAPGTDILSANTDSDGNAYGYVAASGTSMASPQVAGAAAVVRHAQPDWTPRQIKAALMLTADPVVTAAGESAPVTIQGAGRVNLARAIDPGLLVQPPSLDLAAVRSEGSLSLTLTDVRANAAEPATYRVVEDRGTGPMTGTAILGLPVDASVTVPPSGQVNFRLPVDLAGLPTAPGFYDGRVTFESDDHVVRVAYRLAVLEERKDVLLLNVRRSYEASDPEGTDTELVDTTDYSQYWIDALETAELSYDLWTVASDAHDASPPLSTLQRYDLVILAAGDGNAPLNTLESGMTSLQMFLLGGGRMLVSGNDYPHNLTLDTLFGMQTHGSMHFLSRYFAGFDLTDNDVTTPDQLLPVRLFHEPIALSDRTTTAAAGNGGIVDFGQPLAELELTSDEDSEEFPPDMGIAAPLVVDRLMPYMRSYVEDADGRSAVTGVTANATLEHPERADFIPWRALFAGFGFEAVRPENGHHSRAELVTLVHNWAVEPDGVEVDISGPSAGQVGATLPFEANATLPDGVDIQSWRWDRGDGRRFVSGASSLSASFPGPGEFTVRAEALTFGGHTYVAEHTIEISGSPSLYLPLALKDAAIGANR